MSKNVPLFQSTDMYFKSTGHVEHSELTTNFVCHLAEPSEQYTRSTPVAKTVPAFFRPYTNHGVTGWKFVGNVLGVTQRVEDKAATIITTIRESVLSQVTVPKVDFGDLNQYQKDSVLSRSYAAAREEAFDWATNAGELPEVIRMLAGAKRRLLLSFEETVKEYVKRYRKDPKKLLTMTVKDIMGLWLEVRYGWRPLISSLVDLTEALESLEKEQKIAIGIDTWSREIPGYKATVSVLCPQTNMKVPVTVSTVHTVTLRGRTAILMSSNDRAFNSQVLATAWELVPLSFVVDWLLDVSKFLRSLSSMVNESDSTHCVSLETKSKVIIQTNQGSWDNSNPKKQWHSSGCNGVYEQFAYTRTTVDGPTPTIRGQLHLDIPKGIDLLALLVQRHR